MPVHKQIEIPKDYGDARSSHVRAWCDLLRKVWHSRPPTRASCVGESLHLGLKLILHKETCALQRLPHPLLPEAIQPPQCPPNSTELTQRSWQMWGDKPPVDPQVLPSWGWGRCSALFSLFPGMKYEGQGLREVKPTFASQVTAAHASGVCQLAWRRMREQYLVVTMVGLWPTPR